MLRSCCLSTVIAVFALAWAAGAEAPEAQAGAQTPSVRAGTPPGGKDAFHPLDYAVLFVYLGSQLCMGFHFAKRGKSTNDFFLAGQRIPWWAVGLSIFGTQLSAITFMAVPAKTYATNWLYIVNTMGIVAIAPVIIYLYLPFYRRLNVTSAYEYLEKRFNVGVRLFGSAAYVLLQLGRMSVVLFLPSVALATVTGLNVYLSILLMGVVTTVYTVLGGMEAVIWTDVVQVFVLAGGAIVALGFAVLAAGGPMEVVSTGMHDAKFQTLLFSWDYTQPAVWVMLLSWFALLTPYTADQTIVQRYMTTKDEKQSARGIWTNALLSIPSAFIFFPLGTALYCFYKAHPEHLNPAISTDAILPWFVVHELPAGIPGLVVAGVFAASMSTLSSIMNSVATAIITDFGRRFRPGVADRVWLWCARSLTLVLGVLVTVAALVMATYNIVSMWDQWNKIMGVFGGSLAALFILGIFTKRANGAGAIIGAVVSAAALYYVEQYTHIHFFLYGAIGILVCSVVGYGSSLILPARKRSLSGLSIYTLPDKHE